MFTKSHSFDPKPFEEQIFGREPSTDHASPLAHDQVLPRAVLQEVGGVMCAALEYSVPRRAHFGLGVFLIHFVIFKHFYFFKQKFLFSILLLFYFFKS